MENCVKIIMCVLIILGGINEMNCVNGTTTPDSENRLWSHFLSDNIFNKRNNENFTSYTQNTDIDRTGEYQTTPGQSSKFGRPINFMNDTLDESLEFLFGDSNLTECCDVTTENITMRKIENTIKGDYETVYIGGLFELSGSRDIEHGQSELTAAKLAVSHINTRRILPGYNLELLYNDTKCDPGSGMDAFYDLIYRKPQVLMVMGSACAEVTKTLAEIVPYWNLILISYASTSPALTDREKYKTFFRLAMADSSHNHARRKFIQHFQWEKVATFYENKPIFSLAMNELSETFELSNISLTATESFRVPKTEIPSKIRHLKNLDVRIIIGGFSGTAARQVLCEAYKLGMYGPRYVWIFMGDFQVNWLEISDQTECSLVQLAKAAEGYFIFETLTSLLGNETALANLTIEEFLEDYLEENGTMPVSQFATATYDTVWTIALALRRSLGMNFNLTSFSYETGATITKSFFKIIEKLNFGGVSGSISFQGPDRKGIAVINQNQGGVMKRVALVKPDVEILNFNCPFCVPIIWQGGRVPKGKIIIFPRQKTISFTAFYSISACSLVGVVLALFFLGYNLYHRNLRYIKLSSPKLNNVAVIGCILVYSGVVFLGLDDNTMSENVYPMVCTMRAFLFAAGFSLAFGAMFTKTYRVHQIFTRANSGLIKSKLLKDTQLLFIIGALLVVDFTIVLVWVFVDPMHRQITNFTEEVSKVDEDLVYISQLSKCHSNHSEKWMGILYAFKGLLLIFGVYMAWETRNVKIPALNDSQYIGMNVYNVVIMSVIVVVLSNILSHQPTLAYTMESAFVLLSTTVTLCLLFIPKIYAILTCGTPVIVTSGITVEANTRRFIFEDRHELYYRAEVQNRVYKRESVELDQKICRLERLLELPIQPYPKLTEELIFLLPESKVDPSPGIHRRRFEELERCHSISDCGEICMGVSDETTDEQTTDLACEGNEQKINHIPSKKRNIRDKTADTARKLCHLGRSFSFGAVSTRHEYVGLQTSPDEIKMSFKHYKTSPETRMIYPLKRQVAIEDKHDDGNETILKYEKQSHNSNRNEISTYLTHFPDTDDQPTDVNIPLSFQSPFLLQSLPQAHHKRKMSACCTSAVSRHLSDSDFSRYMSLETDICIPVRQEKLPSQRNLPLDASIISCIDETEHDGKAMSKMSKVRTIIEKERRVRIQKLQADLLSIQKELQDLHELEYEVSCV